jgi:hypothetical protein
MTSRQEELLRRVEEIVAETERDAARVGREDADRDTLRESAARRGELGPDWLEVQARIDGGRTSLGAVFGGQDDTPAAVRLRERSRSTLDELRLPDELTDQVETLRGELP